MYLLASDWNSLEIAKLAVSILTPVLVLAIGLGVNRSLKRLEHRQWASQRIIQKRLEIFDELAPSLNDLLCYFTFVGSWKELTPVEVIKMKRRIDRIVHVNAALFSRNFRSKYSNFMGSCYETYTGFGRDAKLRTTASAHKAGAGDGWDPKWDDCFSDEETDPGAVRSAYHELMNQFSVELGIEENHSSRK
ncbi:MAG TPA: hypothetical protein VIF64_10235 [Pyrinomonadaceae bacterium]|jgi:hypothetical protein